MDFHWLHKEMLDDSCTHKKSQIIKTKLLKRVNSSLVSHQTPMNIDELIYWEQTFIPYASGLDAQTSM
jgi:hypothetical protein